MNSRFSVVFVFLIAACACTAESATIHVDGGGGTEFTAIQPALDAAVAGDTILVADGIYTGPQNRDLDFHGRAVVLQSVGGAGSCIIDCEGAARGFTFDDGEPLGAVVEGFRVVNGHVAGEGRGGGIYIALDSSPTIRDCVIESCEAYWGAGIMIHDAGCAPVIERCVIRQNTFSWGGGGGVGVSGGATPVIRQCLIAENATGWGPGVLADWNTGVQLTRCTIADNVAIAGGSARNVTAWHGGQITLNSCIVWGGGTAQMNSAPFNDGVISATFSCIEGGFGGAGNIALDPQFVGDGTYALAQGSPCIDSGDPALPDDPDGSPADMGAWLFPDPPLLAFTDIFSEAGFTDWTYVNQPIVIDFDEDGWDDLLFTRRDGMGPRLFLNDQSGGFVEDNASLGILMDVFPEIAAFGDIDNDGDVDVATVLADQSLKIYERVDGSLVDVTPPAFAGLTYRWVGLLDSENDGDLDILGIMNDIDQSAYLYVNRAGEMVGQLIDVDADRATVADFDLDGDPDILVTHYRLPNTGWAPHTVLGNNGDNTFDVVTETGLPPLPNYAPCVFDYDNDGDLDIYNGTPDWGDPSHPWLFRNDGPWTFTDVSPPSLDIGQHYYAAAVPGDPDRDGDLDFYNTIGAWTDAQYFENLDGVDFQNASAAYGLDVGGGNTGTTGVWLDYDRDNDLDLFVTSTWNANGGWLFRNDISSNNWLKILPVATVSNSTLAGTRVVVHRGAGSQIQHYERNLSCYPDSYSRTKFFGLGESAAVDSVVVHWAAGGATSVADVEANQLLTIHETTPDPPLPIPYWEDFDDNVADDFQVVSGSWDIVDGAYHCYNPETGVKHLAAIGDHTWTDYRVSVDILAFGAPEQEFLFRYQDPDNWYLFVVLAEPYNRAAIWKCADGEQTLLLVVENVFHEPGVPHRLAVEAEGDQFRAYLDGEYLFGVRDQNDPYLSGGVALSAFADPTEGWHDVTFDRFAVLPLDMPVATPDAAPRTLTLGNYPNPFNPLTTIAFTLPAASDVDLAIYDVAGRLVRPLVCGHLAAGEREIVWDGRDIGGGRVASGTYFCRLAATGEVVVRKLVLVQ